MKRLTLNKKDAPLIAWVSPGCVQIFLHGHLSIAGDSRDKITFTKMQNRGVTVDSLAVVMKMMTGECTDIEICLSEHEYRVVTATAYAEWCTLSLHQAKHTCIVLYKECTDIEICLSEHEYRVVTATAYAEWCTLSLHQAKHTCIVLYNDYIHGIHGAFADVDVFKSTVECNPKAKYIRKAGTFERTFTRHETAADIEDIGYERWLNWLSVAKDRDAVEAVAERFLDHLKVERRKKLMKLIKEYEKNGLVKIIEEYASESNSALSLPSKTETI